MTRRRWVVRVLAAAVVWAVVVEITHLLRDDPDPLRLALVVAVLGAAASLLLDGSAAVSAAVWPLDPAPTTGLGRADPRTATLLRLLESHRTAADPDPVLRDRLRDLTDRTLRVRHDLTLDDPRAEAVVPPGLLAALTGPPRRWRAAEIDRLLGWVEAL